MSRVTPAAPQTLLETPPCHSVLSLYSLPPHHCLVQDTWGSAQAHTHGLSTACERRLGHQEHQGRPCDFCSPSWPTAFGVFTRTVCSALSFPGWVMHACC